MSTTIPQFRRPLNGASDPKVDVSFWDKALDAFDNKKYRDALICTLNYMNSSLLEGVDTSGDFYFERGQGSALVRLDIKGDKFIINAPFLRITDSTNKIALMRKVSEVNFSPLTIVQIRLKDDTLWFGYEMPLSLCEPYKVYDVIRDTCSYADDYDDEFVEKYKASFYQDAKTTRLSPEDELKVGQQIDDILKDYQKYSAYFANNRLDNFQWDICVISILKLANMPYMNGTLRTELQEYVTNMFNSNIDFQFRIDKGTNFMKKLCAMTKDEIFKNIYNADAVISLKFRSSTEFIQGYMKDCEDIINDYVKSQDNFTMCYYLQFSFLHLIYTYNLEEYPLNAIYNVLEEVSGIEAVDAAPKLLATYYELLNGTVSGVENNPKKGIFSKLFN